MAAQQEEEVSGCADSAGCCRCLAVLAAIAGLVYLLVLLGTSNGATYSVTVAGVAGLDPAADLLSAERPALSPVFNLTVHIDNSRGRLSSACVTRFSAAAVSYGDALLARCSVPAFCAEVGQEGERGATAWGQDVEVPRFLRERLAGELERGEGEVDVQVKMPGSCPACSDAVLVCKAKIGGGPSPCWMGYVNHYPRSESAAGSTSLSAYK